MYDVLMRSFFLHRRCGRDIKIWIYVVNSSDEAYSVMESFGTFTQSLPGRIN